MAYKRSVIIFSILIINIVLSFILIAEYSFAQVKPESVSAVFAMSDGGLIHSYSEIEAPVVLDWRGILVGGDHGEGDIHHDNIYVKIENGTVLYQTTVPARKENNLLPDEGLLWHVYTRDTTEFSLYATSCWKDNTESDLSLPLELSISYPSMGCTEQTVPVAVAGEDRIVQVGAPVTLDASLSTDPYGPDSGDLVYRWVCYSAPESTVALSDGGKAAVITFTPNAAGKYYFRLNVRDQLNAASFNRSQVVYLRVSAVNNLSDPGLVDANSGRIQEVVLGDTVTLDGSKSKGPAGVTTYQWHHENPLGQNELEGISSIIGEANCGENCYTSNYDADSDVDGADLALLVLNWGEIVLPDNPVVNFTAGIPGPYIFTLTVTDGIQTDSESTIVAVHHENVETVHTPPIVDSGCL